MNLIEVLRSMLDTPPPLPGRGKTAERHEFFFELGRRNLSLARLSEAHWDAVAILADAGREPVPRAIYGVWAAEVPGRSLTLSDGVVNGTKPFCSGAGLIDRALVTVAEPTEQMVEIDLRGAGLTFDDSQWHTAAFSETKTSSVIFKDVRVASRDVVGNGGFYLDRPGFWHGACGPACCWAGGASALVDWAVQQSRKDPHTLAHLGAMSSNVWAFTAMMEAAGREIDLDPQNFDAALIRALRLRHLIEALATDILRRLARAYGPHPLVFEAEIAAQYQELDIYLRQSHAERDLQKLGAALKK